MKRISLHLLLSFIFLMIMYGPSLAQDVPEEEEGIVTDRPDQTEAAVVLKKGQIQLETGTMTETTRLTSDISVHSNTYNTSLLRIGLTGNAELRFIQEFAGTTFKSPNGDFSSSGMGPLAVGGKFHIADEKGLLPQMCLIGHVTLKTGDKAMRPDHVMPDFRFSFEHTLTDRIGMGYNLGAEWDGTNPHITYIYTYVIGADLTDKLGMFIEAYGFILEKTTGDHRLDGGITYCPANNLQFDISGGIGLSQYSPDHFISGGVSYRLPH